MYGSLFYMISATPTIIAPYQLDAGDEVLRMPVGSFRLPGRSTAFIEVIRFAGANRLCVALIMLTPKDSRAPGQLSPIHYVEPVTATSCSMWFSCRIRITDRSALIAFWELALPIVRLPRVMRSS